MPHLGATDRHRSEYDSCRSSGDSQLRESQQRGCLDHPGGEVNSEPEPDWVFTEEVNTVHLQQGDPLNSRLIWINESAGKISITSDYIGTWLGRPWKCWVVVAHGGDGLAVVCIGGVRFERKLVRQYCTAARRLDREED